MNSLVACHMATAISVPPAAEPSLTNLIEEPANMAAGNETAIPDIGAMQTVSRSARLGPEDEDQDESQEGGDEDDDEDDDEG
jgi:hypothetical protein